MKHWVSELDHLLATGNEVIRVVVAATKGSTPREAGATMLVHSQGIAGTLGGGHLEFKAIALAHALLDQQGNLAQCQRFTLGAALGQCCGGIVDVWWERFTASDREFIASVHAQLQRAEAVVLASLIEDKTCKRMMLVAGDNDAATPWTEHATALMHVSDGSRTRLLQHEKQTILLERLDRKPTPLWLFGAGHVGQAVVASLRELPFDITWVDSRENVYPADLSADVTTLISDLPATEVRHAPEDAWFLVMTHDHDLDYAICAAILARDDPGCRETSGFIGLIGSRTKAARFNHKLIHQGYPAERITCPIGIPGITGKEPATIAISVVAQLLQLREAQQAGFAIQPAAHKPLREAN